MTRKDVSSILQATKQDELRDPISVLKYQNMVRHRYIYIIRKKKKEFWKDIKLTVVRSWVLLYFLFLFSSNF